ncbi:MAG: DUF3786 domain-containing protein [Desulfobacteraceae bacterium]|nr:DUF3786 domain-containing protein [Desulfobacteraceae bacterium]
MTQLIDKILFRDLLSCDSEDVTKRTGALYDKKKGHYSIKIWGNFYDVMPEQYLIKPREQKVDTYRDYLYLFMLHYLMKVKQIPLSGQWISEKDIPGGVGFFRGPHTLPTEILAQVFGNDLSGFLVAGERLGGKSLPMADAAFSFDIAPQIPVAVLLWLGDEEFGSQVKLLFDKTIEQQLPLDIIYALAVEVCHAF